MKFYYIPETLTNKNRFHPTPTKYHYVCINKQKFAPLLTEKEVQEALSANKVIVSFSQKGFKHFLQNDIITEIEELEENLLEEPPSSTCNIHLLPPIYSATNKLLGTGMILLGVGAPLPIAIPIAFIGAACNFYVQYQFITKTASGPRSLDYQVSDVQRALGWKDELLAATNVISSISEGTGIAAAVFLSASANELSLTTSAILALLAFKLKQGTAMQSDGQKIFIQQSKDFSQTRVGWLANLTQQFPPKYPILLDFNSWVKNFLPAMDALLSGLSFHAFLEKRIDNGVVCAMLSTLVCSGDWYQQRGFNVNLIKHVQQLANVAPPLGLAHIIDVIIRVYNESIGNIVNGRLVNDIVGIIIPPALWELIIKVAANFFMGYVSAGQVTKILPDMAKRLGISIPDDVSSLEPILSPIVACICSIAAISQYKAAYDKNLKGLPIGIKPLLEKVYGGASVTGFGVEDITHRFDGWRQTMKAWPQRFFKVGTDFISECRANYPCFQEKTEQEIDLEAANSLDRSLLN